MIFSMNLGRLASIVKKEMRQLKRDQQLFGLFVFAPLLQLFFFGYAVSTDLKGVRLGIALEDSSPEARRLIQAIETTHTFRLERVSVDPEDMRAWLDSGTVDVALHIDRDFARDLENGQSPCVQILSDGSDSNTATVAYQYLSGAALSWAGQARAERLRRHPEAAIRFTGIGQVNVIPRFWYNPDLRSINYMIPGVLTVILLSVAMSHTAMMVVKERELGTLEQISVTPIRAIELLVGKTIPVAAVGIITAAMITLVAHGWFHVPLRGPISFLAVSGTLYLLNTMGMGLLVSVVSRTQLQAQLITNILTSPLILLSGFLFPIENMPAWAQYLTYAMPTRHYMEIVRGVFLKGQGWEALWPQALSLACLGTLLYLAGVLMFKKRLS